jgi:hypothetical protein
MIVAVWDGRFCLRIYSDHLINGARCAIGDNGDKSATHPNPSAQGYLVCGKRALGPSSRPCRFPRARTGGLELLTSRQLLCCRSRQWAVIRTRQFNWRFDPRMSLVAPGRHRQDDSRLRTSVEPGIVSFDHWTESDENAISQRGFVPFNVKGEYTRMTASTTSAFRPRTWSRPRAQGRCSDAVCLQDARQRRWTAGRGDNGIDLC